MDDVDFVMKELMGQCPPPQNFWARTTPGNNCSLNKKQRTNKQMTIKLSEYVNSLIGVQRNTAVVSSLRQCVHCVEHIVAVSGAIHS